MIQNKLYDTAIIGGGISGMTAAIKLASLNKDIIIIDKESFGNKLSKIKVIHESFFPNEVSGEEIAKSLKNQMRRFTNIYDFGNGNVVLINYQHGLIKLNLSDGTTIFSKSLIIASGTETVKIDNKVNELFDEVTDDLLEKFKNKSVLIDNDSIDDLDNALCLAKSCKNVYVCMQGKEIIADTNTKSKILKAENIKLLPNAELIQINTETTGKVSSVKVKNNGTIRCFAVFSRGKSHVDNSLYKNFTKIDTDGYIITDEFCYTNFPGIYAIGDCRAKINKSICSNITDAEIAVLKINGYLNALK